MKYLIILISIITISSCRMIYGDKKVVKVTKIDKIITYDFNYGGQIFTFGKDTVLKVGSWEDENGLWHQK